MYKRQGLFEPLPQDILDHVPAQYRPVNGHWTGIAARSTVCLLYTSDAADERSSVDLGGRRIIKKKKKMKQSFIILFDTRRTNTDHGITTLQAI